MNQDRVSTPVAALLVFLVLSTVVFVVYMSSVEREEENRNWQQFLVRHHCTHVGHRAAQQTQGYGPRGYVTSTIPAQEGWLCDDDGITYWR